MFPSGVLPDVRPFAHLRTGDGTALLPLDAAVNLLPASLADFGIKHVEFDRAGSIAVSAELRAVPEITG